MRVVRSLRSRHGVIAPDLPDFGQSHAAPTFAGTLAAYATSVQEFCESLNLRFVLFGCDAGACVGLAAAAAMCPLIIGLVMADTVPIPLTGRAWVIKIVLRHVITSLPMRFLNRRLNLLPWLVATVDPPPPPVQRVRARGSHPPVRLDSETRPHSRHVRRDGARRCVHARDSGEGVSSSGGQAGTPPLRTI